MLFASDVILPRMIPGLSGADAWLAQLLAAGWLGVAALNWLGQSALLGGIYGRPQVMANLALYFISATTLLRTVSSREVPATVWIVAAVCVAFALTYGWLLFRGPFQRDFELHGQGR